MVKKFRQAVKNEKGLTLVELLAVVVILGIISAIAIPSIGGLINNSKKDAHIANAQQMVNAAKIMVTAQEVELTNNSATIKLSELTSKGYLEPVKNPSNKDGGYNEDTSVISIEKEADNNYYTYKVTLIDGTIATTTYINDKDPFEIERSEVTLKE